MNDHQLLERSIAIAVLCTLAMPSLAASELIVLATPNMRPLLPALSAVCERAGGPKLSLSYAAPPEIKSRLEGGKNVDVVITLKGQADALAKNGRLAGVTTVIRSPIVIAVRAGKPRPDVSSPSALKEALLKASSIVHSNGGPSGVIAQRIVRALGIEEQIKPKLKLVPPGGQALPAAISSGEAELGIDQLTVLQNKPGIEVVGSLPKELSADIVMSAGRTKSAANPAEAANFLKCLKSPESAPAIKAHGMMPE
jgi:molybdate transport system substrate-binding protein